MGQKGETNPPGFSQLHTKRGHEPALGYTIVDDVMVKLHLLVIQ